MSSEAAFEVAPMVGNTHLGQRGSGHSAVPSIQPRIQTPSWRDAGLGPGRGDR